MVFDFQQIVKIERNISTESDPDREEGAGWATTEIVSKSIKAVGTECAPLALSLTAAISVSLFLLNLFILHLRQ